MPYGTTTWPSESCMWLPTTCRVAVARFETGRHVEALAVDARTSAASAVMSRTAERSDGRGMCAQPFSRRGSVPAPVVPVSRALVVPPVGRPAAFRDRSREVLRGDQRQLEERRRSAVAL